MIYSYDNSTIYLGFDTQEHKDITIKIIDLTKSLINNNDNQASESY